MANPKFILNKFRNKCNETKLIIQVGELCVYNPSEKKIYSLESEFAKIFDNEYENILYNSCN